MQATVLVLWSMMGASMGVLQWPERVTATTTHRTMRLVEQQARERVMAELAAELAVFFAAALGQSNG